MWNFPVYCTEHLNREIRDFCLISYNVNRVQIIKLRLIDMITIIHLRRKLKISGFYWQFSKFEVTEISYEHESTTCLSINPNLGITLETIIDGNRHDFVTFEPLTLIFVTVSVVCVARFPLNLG